MNVCDTYLSIRTKTLILTGAILFGLLAAVSFSADQFYLRDFKNLEHRQTIRNLERVTAALQTDLKQLDSTAGDWAPWDETYTFVVNHNQAYIHNNLSDETLANLRINCIAYLDTDRRLIHRKCIDLRSKHEMRFPDSLQRMLVSQPELLPQTDRQKVLGVVLLPEGPVLLAAQPILHNDFSGPSHGTLVIGRFLDANELHILSNQVKLQITSYCYTLTSFPDKMRQAYWSMQQGSDMAVLPLSETSIAGVTRLHDLSGNPVLVLQIITPRTIYQQGKTTGLRFLWVLLGIGVFCALVFVAQLDRVVLNRVSRLHRELADIGSRHNLSDRVTDTGPPCLHDEIDSLTTAINRVLDSQERSHHQLLQQEAIRKSDERYRTLIEHSPDAVLLLNSEGRCLFSNVAGLSLFGFTHPEEVTGFLLPAAITPEDREAVNTLLQAGFAGQTPSRIECRLLRLTGEPVEVEMAMTAFSTRDEPAVQVILHDISARKQDERAIHDYQARLRALASELSAAEEQERRRIAAILHDQIGQLLVVARLSLGTVRAQLRQPELSGQIEEVRELLEQTIQGTRTLTIDLSPPVLANENLAVSLRWLADQFTERHGLHIDIAEKGSAIACPLEIRSVLFRAVRELLHNVVKHAGATRVEISLSCPDHCLQIMVQDNGRGFPASPNGTAAGLGFGLFSIRERLNYLGGTMDIATTTGNGTCVTLRLPETQPESG